MTKLVVSTLTDRREKPWRDLCFASVRAALPFGALHTVTIMDERSDYQRERWLSTVVESGAEYVAWVDDDDVVDPDALERCLGALEQSGAAIAFTHEAWIDADGRSIAGGLAHRPRTRRDIAMHPRQLHHLAVVRRECLSPEVLDAAIEIGCGIDWLMRAWCALRHGVVQVPMVGYYWRKHGDQMTGSAERDAAYIAAMPRLREFLRPLVGADKVVPQWA